MAQTPPAEQMSWRVCKDTAQTWVAGGCAGPRGHRLPRRLGERHLGKNTVLVLRAMDELASLLEVVEKHRNKTEIVS